MTWSKLNKNYFTFLSYCPLHFFIYCPLQIWALETCNEDIATLFELAASNMAFW